MKLPTEAEIDQAVRTTDEHYPDAPFTGEASKRRFARALWIALNNTSADLERGDEDN